MGRVPCRLIHAPDQQRLAHEASGSEAGRSDNQTAESGLEIVKVKYYEKLRKTKK